MTKGIKKAFSKFMEFMDVYGIYIKNYAESTYGIE